MPDQPAAVMLGEWSYGATGRTSDPPILNTGLHVAVRIDSLQGARVWGRVTLWFVGDVGVAPNTFGRVSGTVDGTNRVTLIIPREPTDARPLMVIGELAGDVLTVVECLAGTEPGPFAAHSTFLRLRTGED